MNMSSETKDDLKRKIGDHAKTVRSITDDMLDRAERYDQAIGDEVEQQLIDEIQMLNETLARFNIRYWQDAPERRAR